MKYHNVTWTIEIWADTPEEAARQALAIQRDANSIATFFEVTGADGVKTEFDLTPEHEA